VSHGEDAKNSLVAKNRAAASEDNARRLAMRAAARGKLASERRVRALPCRV